MSLAKLSLTLNTASEIFTLPPQRRLKERDRQGSEPASGGLENMTGRSLFFFFSHQHAFPRHGCHQSFRLLLSEQDHPLLLPQRVERRTLGTRHSTSRTPVFQLR